MFAESMVIDLLEAVKAWVFPASGILLACYPAFFVVMVVVQGRSSGSGSSSTSSAPQAFAEQKPASAEFDKAKRGRCETRRRTSRRISSLSIAVCASEVGAAALVGQSVGFVAPLSCGFGHSFDERTLAPVSPDSELPLAPSSNAGAAAGASRLVAGAASLAACCAAAAALAASRRAAAQGPAGVPPHRAGRVLRFGAAPAPTQAHGVCQLPEGVPQYSAPSPTSLSLWHDIELRVTNWLDQDTGLFRYVNEMPLGSLQKFEVQPHVENNAIAEDPKGSTRLAAFGRPVPFNYGCLPQTYRDPKCMDDLYNAPGDDDPLDILDLGDCPVGVGEVVQCRVLGAVCLIDEGQADWKILAVNTEVGGKFSEATSIEDIDRIAPGRVSECLQWIDDFKQSSGKGEAKLHFNIHGEDQALRLIERDFASWGELVRRADASGRASGHWVRPAQSAAHPQALQLPLPKHTPSCAVPGRLLSAPSSLAGASLRASQSALALVHSHASAPGKRALTLPQEDHFASQQTPEFARVTSP